MELSELVTAHVYKLYDSLGKTGKPKTDEEWTNLAAFVFVEKEGGADRVSVASMATGTKCVGSTSLCPEGKVVSDSHAEVLARRALLLNLYDEIEKAQINEGGSNLFTHRTTAGKWKLKTTVELYFFTSHVPCGDASIIPFENNELTANDDLPPEKKIKLDVHRTGAKPVGSESRKDPKGEGLEYHCRGAVRIKPGRGDPTKSLSCSDKIARWIDCGVEGALLSTLIDGPLRIKGIVVGGTAQYNEQVIVEALVKRSKTEQTPLFLRCPKSFKHSPGSQRPCSQSIIWSNVKSKKLEVAVEGRKLGATKKSPDQSLRIAKVNLFRRFLTLTVDRYSPGVTYREVKNRACGYKAASDRFKANMGAWSEDKTRWEMFTVENAV